MSSWIDSLLEASKEAETPHSWIYWSGIATISAVISPNVWINRGGIYKLSPNVFIMLIGESGFGKGFPIAISKGLLREVNCTRIISGANTIQAIVQKLGQFETDEKTGIPNFKDSRAYIVSGEFATLLAEDRDAIPILTELYDGHWNPEWVKSTKNSGNDNLKKPMVTLFGGSTIEHFGNSVSQVNINGGFAGRLLTSFENERSKINPLSNTEVEFDFPFKPLSEHLKNLKIVAGPFKFEDKKTIDFWEDIYRDIRTKKVHDPTGAINRLPDNILKVAMCVSLAKDLERIIRFSDLEEAQERCFSLVNNSKRLSDGQGPSASAAGAKLVIWTLYNKPDHTMTKKEFLRMHYGQFDMYEFDKIVETLERAEMIKVIKDDNGDLALQMLDKQVDLLRKWIELKGKKK